ncbi:hypothetical protein, partial [Azospirillum sp. TSO35-2]|uniref:hypothetical protein n=1 Tax=Azospirillum sp. TSO35-2 TaxID=716796 RepID=UPI001B3BCA64
GLGEAAYKAPPDANDAGAAEPAAIDLATGKPDKPALRNRTSQGSGDCRFCHRGGIMDKFIPCCEKGCAGGGCW